MINLFLGHSVKPQKAKIQLLAVEIHMVDARMILHCCCFH